MSPRMNPYTAALLPTPMAMVITRATATVGVRAKLRTE
jgi:hypothetical protein